MGKFDLYLIRHEEAAPAAGFSDADRFLTGLGRRRMRATSRLVGTEAPGLDAIITSPLVRAVQTAEILADAVGIDEPVVAERMLVDPPTLQALVDLIAGTPSNLRGLALVGHEPTMSALSAHLLGIDRFPRSFRPGTVLRLSYDRQSGQATFEWLVAPDGPTLVTEL